MPEGTGMSGDRADLIPLVDLDDADADKLLAALRNVGLTPEVRRIDTGRSDGAMTRPLVRVLVPRNDLSDARRVATGVLPHLGVSGPHQPADPTDDGDRQAGRLAPSEAEQWSQIVSDLRSGGGWEAARALPEPEKDDVEHFVPPEPPPLPRPQRITLAAWIAVIGGLALVLISAILHVGGLLAVVGLAAFISGFVALVSRARGNADRDDPDQGAVL